MIFDRHAHLKYKYGNRHFWCRGYYVDTVGKNTKKIQEYIQHQFKEIEENNRMGKTRILFKKIRDSKGTFHAKMGTIKDRNDKDLTEAEEIKKW